MTTIPAAVCAHPTLRWGSGGFYLFCCDCPQSWVAMRVGGKGDTDIDNRAPSTCQTPLAATGGTFEWRPRERKAR